MRCGAAKALDCPAWGISGRALTGVRRSIASEASVVPRCCETCEQLARIVIRGVTAGKTVEIDGLGVFSPDPKLGFRFEPRALPQVFLSYAKEDAAIANRLYANLNSARCSAWVDQRKLMPG